jgi:hypothetical protein
MYFISFLSKSPKLRYSLLREKARKRSASYLIYAKYNPSVEKISLCQGRDMEGLDQVIR